MADKFNAEAANRAISNATAKIEELIKKHQDESSMVSDNFGQNAAAGAALGGAVGAAAQSAYEAGSNTEFANLNSNIANFMNNRVETIVKNSTNMSDQANAVYSNIK